MDDLQKIADATGFGEVPQDTEEETENQEPDKSEEDKQEPVIEKPKEETEKSETEEEEDDQEPNSNKHTVPYQRLKAERERRREAEEKLNGVYEGLDDKVQEAVKSALADISSKPKSEQLDEAEKAAEELAEELNLDKDGLAKILRKAADLSKNKVSPELEERLKRFEEFEKSQKVKDDETRFQTEWKDELTSIKRDYPNATDEMLTEAKEEMDKLAHSKEHNTHEMGYILYKNRDKFDKLLKVSPKGKSGEIGKEIGSNEEDTDVDNVDIEDITPEIMKKREQEDTKRNRTSEKIKEYHIINPIKGGQ